MSKSECVWKGVASLVTLALLVAFANIPLAGASSTLVRFDPASASLAVGQASTVNIRVDDVTGLAGVDIYVMYNAAVLDVVDADSNVDGVQISAGSFLKPDFVAQNIVDTVQGKISFSILQLPPHSPVSGSGVLASVTFRGKASGSSALTFTTVNLAGEGGAAIPYTSQNGQVTVGGAGGPTATPVVPTSTPVPGYPTATPVPVYPTATPVPGYPTATPVPGYPTATPVPYTPPAGILGYHTVLHRETLFCIGRAYGVSPWAIASQNNVPFPYTLRLGQRLAIPNSPWANIPAGPVCPRQFQVGQPQPPPPQPSCRASYVVRPGDTLSSIAWRYGSSVWAIATANSISNPNLIFPGQVLCIP